MKHFRVRVLIVSLWLGICSAFLFAGAALGQSCEQWGGKIASVQGAVQAKKAGESKWIPVGLNATYCPGDMIRVLKNSRAAIVLSNETLFRLDQNTTVTFTGVEKEKTFLINMLEGVTHFFSRHPRRLKVVTPFLNAAVEGTEFYVRVEQDQTFLSIFEGRVAASNKAGSLGLSGGQSAVAVAGKAPVLKIVVRPRDAVQWALYYPPVMYLPPGEAPKEDINDPRFLAYRASQLLAVGRVDEADADIKRALSLDPKYSDAFALQSIIAVVQNERDKALSAAQKAIDTGPNSATAHIAMSYAQQAGFDLGGARTSVEEALKLDPNNALAWARLAELWSSFGRLGKALGAAKKAVGLDPSLSRTQMVLGFAYLVQVKTTESKTAFEKAIELDQADPLSRLGLGLAKIRDGDLQAGGREIEIAASLDPNNSLVRSYLGKTYFEEKRTDLDGREYAIAKELDPKDSTPWFYDAIRKQTINRPVEALQDMQKSIELNDNRAVYRSRLLLDEDLASRSASLGRIYNDLGFQQLGLVEGWKSVNTAPANFSAHRLLADLYTVQPRHQIARVSELLQSQLLQPLNVTPVQPQLAESNLLILEGTGPSDASFNEFNPLFLRNRFALQANGVVGENETWGDDLVQSTVWGRFSYSLGQFHYETDGFRENNDQEQDIYNAFAQVSLTPKTSLQAEYRYTDIEKGDLSLNFSPDNFLPNLRIDEEDRSVRFGFRHNFSTGSDVIGSFSYQDAKVDLRDEPEPGDVFDDKLEDDSYGGELQHLYRSQWVNFVSGVGYFYTDRKEISDGDVAESDIHHTNLYFYSYLNFLKSATLTVGGSGDFFDSIDVNRDQFNPKIGLTWNPLPDTTLRAAIFRTLKRLFINNQSIEPTQVAGFNQFFDDAEGTDAWRYGVGIDQKFSNHIYGGVEYSRRDLEVPFEFIEVPPPPLPGSPPPPPSQPEIRKVDWEENLGRAYLYMTPYKWMALSAEYQYEEFDRDKEFIAGIENVKTHRIPLGISFYHPIGFSGQLKATYFDQKGKFLPQGLPPGSPSVHGSDYFWIFDASISYRLPKRFGFLTIGAKNIFDKSFNYQDTDPVSPIIQPERLAFFRLTLSF